MTTDIASKRTPGPRERLTAIIDHHWLAQGPETGTALCTCGEWSFDARVGQHPLPVVGERFAPFSEHVADVVLDLTVTEYRAANTYDELLAVAEAARTLFDREAVKRRRIDHDGSLEFAVKQARTILGNRLAALDAASEAEAQP